MSRTINTLPDVPQVIAINATGALAYTSANQAVPAVPGFTVTSGYATKLTGAMISIATNFVTGIDQLFFVNTSKITGSFDSKTGIMTLTGTDTVANYQLALRSVKYEFVGPLVVSSKVLVFSVTDGVTSSNVVNRLVVVGKEVAPVVATNATGALAYSAAKGLAVVAPGLTVTSPFLLTGATISIGNFVSGSDLLTFAGTANIKGVFDAKTGILTLSGYDTAANYQVVLQSVRYRFVGVPKAGTTKTIGFAVSDGIASNVVVSRTINVGV